jgi:hypothetical protein
MDRIDVRRKIISHLAVAYIIVFAFTIIGLIMISAPPISAETECLYCESCKKPVPITSKVGGTCPHCHVDVHMIAIWKFDDPTLLANVAKNDTEAVV